MYRRDGHGRAPQPGVDDSLPAVRGGATVWCRHDCSLALSRALVLDACYKSALEQREVVL
ncbi:hypothetical protein PJL18_01521 [Paenarthrobacter nicotinovorans]|nr:hypothetical protein [Paenarthrobacter nicotinovorans]